MNLPPEAIDEFRELFLREKGIRLSEEEASRLAHELYSLGKTVLDMASQPSDMLTSASAERASLEAGADSSDETAT